MTYCDHNDFVVLINTIKNSNKIDFEKYLQTICQPNCYSDDHFRFVTKASIKVNDFFYIEKYIEYNCDFEIKLLSNIFLDKKKGLLYYLVKYKSINVYNWCKQVGCLPRFGKLNQFFKLYRNRNIPKEQEDIILDHAKYFFKRDSDCDVLDNLILLCLYFNLRNFFDKLLQLRKCACCFELKDLKMYSGHCDYKISTLAFSLKNHYCFSKLIEKNSDININEMLRLIMPFSKNKYMLSFIGNLNYEILLIRDFYEKSMRLLILSDESQAVLINLREDHDSLFYKEYFPNDLWNLMNNILFDKEFIDEKWKCILNTVNIRLCNLHLVSTEYYTERFFDLHKRYDPDRFGNVKVKKIKDEDKNENINIKKFKLEN